MRLAMCLPPSPSILMFFAILGNITLAVEGKSSINYPNLFWGGEFVLTKLRLFFWMKDSEFRFFKFILLFRNRSSKSLAKETAGFLLRRTSFTIYNYRNNSNSTSIVSALVSAFHSTFEGAY